MYVRENQRRWTRQTALFRCGNTATPASAEHSDQRREYDNHLNSTGHCRECINGWFSFNLENPQKTHDSSRETRDMYDSRYYIPLIESPDLNAMRRQSWKEVIVGIACIHHPIQLVLFLKKTSMSDYFCSSVEMETRPEAGRTPENVSHENTLKGITSQTRIRKSHTMITEPMDKRHNSSRGSVRLFQLPVSQKVSRSIHQQGAM